MESWEEINQDITSKIVIDTISVVKKILHKMIVFYVKNVKIVMSLTQKVGSIVENAEVKLLILILQLICICKVKLVKELILNFLQQQ